MSGIDRLKIMTIVGTRPEVIKMSRIFAEFDKHSLHVMVHSGQNFDYELNEVFYQDLGIRRPDHFLGAARQSLGAAIAAIIESADDLLARESPDALVLYGDTNTCLSVIPAKRRKIPIFHLEAGNRSFDQRVPEEINRKIVDHLSDINLPQTEHARRHLLAEGIRPETIIKVGSPMREVLEHIQPKIPDSDVLRRLDLIAGEYFLVSVHREENVDERRRLEALVQSLLALSDEYRLPIVVSTHPRTRKRLDDAAIHTTGHDIRWLPPFGYIDYLALQVSAKCVLSDSGTLTEESSILGFPAVMLREAHERPEGQDAGVLPFSHLVPRRVLQAVRLVGDHEVADRVPVDDYAPHAVSSTVMKLVQSYVDYVNRTVWGRSDL